MAFDLESSRPVSGKLQNFDINSAVTVDESTETGYFGEQGAVLELPKGGFARIKGLLGGAYDKGLAGLALNELYARQLFGDDTPEVAGSIQQVKDRAGVEIETDNLAEDIARAGAEQIPQLLGLVAKSGQRGLEGSMMGAVLALGLGQMGPQVATPEELATVPAGAIGGFGLGLKFGIAEHSFMQNAGEAYGQYSELLDKSGVQLENRNLARLGAVMVGASNAGLDTVSFGLLSKVFVGKNLVMDTLRSSGMKSLVIPKSKAGITRFLMDLSKAVATETATEGVQEGVKDLGGEMVKYLSPQEFDSLTAEQMFENMGRVSAEAAKATLALGGAGGVVKAGVSRMAGGGKKDVANAPAEIESDAEAAPPPAAAPAINPADIEQVEREFYENARQANVGDQEAMAAAKLVGMRAGAASRALGITPSEWLKSKRISIENERRVTPEADADTLAEAQQIKAALSDTSQPDVRFDRNSPVQVQRRLALPEKPKSVMQFIADQGGISLGLTPEELANVRDARKSRRESAAKIAFAPGEIRHIFDGKPHLGRYLKEDGLGLDELYRRLADAGYLPQQDYADLDATDTQLVLDLIEREVNGQRVYPLYVEDSLGGIEDASLANAEFFEQIGITKDMSDAEIAAALQEYRKESEGLQQRQQPVAEPFDDDVPFFQTPVEKTEAGDQLVIPGAEKIGDRNLAERKMEGGKSSDKAQKPMDIGMFGDEHKQGSLFQDGARPQGQVTFGKEGIIIKLFENANASTLLHELGHVFLRDMRDVAAATDNARAKADYRAVQKWLGAKGNTLTVAQEEKFARGFEAYLREGKAPQPELQGIFDLFKEWLTAIYESVQQLNVTLSPEVRAVFDRMLNGDAAMSGNLSQTGALVNREADYAVVAKTEPVGTFRSDTAAVFRNAGEIAGDAFVPVSTRLGEIDRKLKHAVRRFIFNTGIHSHEDRKVIKPFVERVASKFTPEDYRVFDLALKNRDAAKVDYLVDKYDVQEGWEAVRDTLDKIYIDALDAGLDLNYVEDYFPRKVRRNMAQQYIAALRGQANWSDIEMALTEADPAGAFTDEEKAEFINKWLRGYGGEKLMLTKPGYTKQRTIDYVRPEFNGYYQDSLQTLVDYVAALRHGIEVRKLFGGSSKETDENIGAYVHGLVEQGAITADQEQELKKIFKAVVNPQGPAAAVSWAKNAGYIYLMGSPISAITQVGDLAFAAYSNGYYRAGRSLLRSLTGRQVLKKEDLGIDNILQEFEDETRASKAVKSVFRAVGIEFMDNVGKETFVDSTYAKLRSAAKKNSAEFREMLRDVFGDEATQVRRDLNEGRLSENVKYLLFSELSDFQPISLAEMPVAYLRGGNWRIMYMLKTYTMKQMDIYRREIFDEITSGDMKRAAKGMNNLLRLAMALMLMGAASDTMKDLLLGRDITIDDLVMDNIFKLFGITRYHVYKAKRDGVGDTFFRFLTPPVLAPVDDLRDIPDIAAGEKEAEDAEILQRVPVVGKFYYWWFGGGVEKK